MGEHGDMRLVAALVCAATTQIASAEMTGIELLEFCERTDVVGISWCSSYITAVIETDATLAALKRSIQQVCVPSTVTRDQARRIGTAYLTEHTGMLHLQAAGLMLMALRQEFPCD